MLSNRRQQDQSPNPQIHYGDIFQVAEEPLTQKKLSIVPKRSSNGQMKRKSGINNHNR